MKDHEILKTEVMAINYIKYIKLAKFLIFYSQIYAFLIKQIISDTDKVTKAVLKQWYCEILLKC